MTPLNRFYLALLPCVLSLSPAAAQLSADPQFGDSPAPQMPAENGGDIVITDTTAGPPAQVTPVASELPPEEQMVRAGVVLLSQVQDILADIRDQDSAEAAVAPLMRLNAKLQEWARAFAAQPPLTEEEQRVYEERYLPLIEKLNNRIRTQGERLASAEYYGSRNLPAVLIRLALLNQ